MEQAHTAAARARPRRLAFVAVAAFAVLAFAPHAFATTTTPLPFKAFGAKAFDPVHGRLYVSGGKSDSRVAVLTADGQLEKTLTNLPGASGLAFDTSFSTLSS